MLEAQAILRELPPHPLTNLPMCEHFAESHIAKQYLDFPSYLVTPEVLRLKHVWRRVCRYPFPSSAARTYKEEETRQREQANESKE